MFSVAYAGQLDALSFEQLSTLPPNYVDEIIFRRACELYGPYEVSPYATYP